MSTKVKRSISLPFLPPEIWDCVFDHATHVLGTLVPEIFDQSALIGPLYNQKYHPALRAALVTKRYLVRVCKQWWHLASPYLYRSIYIGRTRCLSSLLSTLLRSVAGQGTLTGKKPLGFWTHRLDVAIRDHGTDFAAEVAMLADVISWLPSLVVASFPLRSSTYDNVTMPATILKALRCSAASLRVLDLSSRFTPSPEDLSELLMACPRLRILNCHEFAWSPGLPLGAIIPNVTTLRLRNIRVPSPAAMIGPQDRPLALKEFILDWGHPAVPDFMRHIGDRLTAIHLHRPVAFAARDAFDCLPHFEEACPNLRRITWSLVSFTDLHPNIHFPPIEYLGLRAESYLSSRSELQYLFSIIANLKTTAPSIRVVQLTDHHNVNCILRSHAQVAAHALVEHELTGCAFRLEDHDGNLLEDRLKALGHM